MSNAIFGGFGGRALLGDLRIEQFSPGRFEADALGVFFEGLDPDVTLQSDSLIIFNYDSPVRGQIELHVIGSGLAYSVDEFGDDSFAGDVTGLELLANGALSLTFSGLSETLLDLAVAISSFAYGSTAAFDALLGQYAVTWDASAATGAVTWDGPATPLGATLIGSANTGDFIFAHDNDTVIAGTNTSSDEIGFTGGDILADLSAAAAQPLSYYALDFRYDADGARLNQGVVATFGSTNGTVDYGNSGDRGTATIIGLDAIDVLGGIGLFTGAGDDVVTIQGDADSFYQYSPLGGDNTFIGGLEFDRLNVRQTGGVIYRIDGYGAGGTFGTAVDSEGGVTTFSGVDDFRGYRGNDQFFGGAGDDMFITEAGNDYVDGGDGFDLVRYNRSGVTGVQVDLSAQTATGVWSGVAFTDTLVNVEFVRGSDFWDVLIGSGGDDRLAGEGGADFIDGGYGADVLGGGQGSDVIFMGGGGNNDASDGSVDVVGGTLSELNGDYIAQIGAEDRISVLDLALTDAQVRLNGHTLSIDGDNDGTFETQMTVYGPALGGGGALTGVVPVLTHVEGAAVPGSPELFSGTQISFAPSISQLTAIGEVVRLAVGTSWQTLSFANTYADAVVFALSPSLNEIESVATRFRNVSATGAEIKLQETKLIIDPATGLQVPNTSGHVDETVTLLVLEKGLHTLEDGTVIEVGEINTNKLYVKGFESVHFSETLGSTPTILSQVQTYNGSDFVISRQTSANPGGFALTLQEEQADNLNHATETVGWLAIEHGSGSLSTMGWQAGSSAANVNGNLTNVAFNEAFDSAPLVVASLASYNGTDTASPRIGAVSTTGFTAMALEDQSYDLETQHGYEVIDWIGFSNEGLIYEAGPLVNVKIAEAGIASVSSEATTISFGSGFVNPVVIATITTTYDIGAAVARISNVTSTGFDLRIQETDNLDGIHGAETVSWVVVEAGSWVLADGTMIQAGMTDTYGVVRQGGFTYVDLADRFDADPAMLSQTQTENDSAFVKTRMIDVGVGAFGVGLEEEEAASWGTHGSETVGWIAVDKGVAADADGFVFEAGDISTNHNWKTETFTGAFDETPGVVAGISTYNFTDTVDTRLRALTDNGFQVHVEEDTSLNSEIAHGLETIDWIAFNGVGELWGDALV